MSESAGKTARKPSSRVRTAVTALCLCVLPLPLTTCTRESYATPVFDCDDTALGTSRLIELTPTAPPVRDSLREREVVITFDDGPAPGQTNKVLDILASQCVQATFFLRGDQAENHPALARTILLAGHSLGAHGWAHAALMEMSLDDARDDIERSVTAINDALAASGETSYERVRLFRFPYVAFNDGLVELVTDLGMANVTVHADGKDWELKDPQDIVENVMTMLARADHRGVILLHDPFDPSPAATERLLNRLKQDGYSIVAIRGVEAGE